MNIKPSFQAIRAVGVAFAFRLYKPVLIAFIIIACVLLLIGLGLTTINSLWIILVIFEVFLIVVVSFLLIAGYALIQRVAPDQTKEQKVLAKSLVGKMQRVAEVTGTPKFILLFNIIKDVAAPSEKGFISSLSNDSGSIKNDFVALRNSFNEREIHGTN